MPIVSCIETGQDLVENCPIGVQTSINEQIYVASTNHLTASPKPIVRTGTTSAAEWNTSVGSFTFEATRGFSKLECTASPKYNDKIEGESGSKGIKATLEVMLQRTPVALGWRSKNKNANLIVVFQDGDGRWCQLGYKGRTSKISEGESELSNEKASMKVTFEAHTEALFLPDTFDPEAS